MALGSTQNLTEISTRSISWGGKGGRCVRLPTLLPFFVFVTKAGNRIFLEPCGPFWACNGTDLPFFNANITWSDCKFVISVVCVKTGKGMYSNTVMSFKMV